MYEQAHNSHDVEKIITLFTDDVQFETQWTNGLQQGRRKYETLRVGKVHLKNHLGFTDLRVCDVFDAQGRRFDDLLRLAGFREIKYDSEPVEFRGDLIEKNYVERTAENE